MAMNESCCECMKVVHSYDVYIDCARCGGSICKNCFDLNPKVYRQNDLCHTCDELFKEEMDAAYESREGERRGR